MTQNTNDTTNNNIYIVFYYSPLDYRASKNLYQQILPLLTDIPAMWIMLAQVLLSSGIT
ncbi:hypothetical protein [Olegusella massiliensis]|uniref:hypothetical protein n=1 Tax=Olegusella massiliensis TaxID=1776381 RepID=UPI000A83148C|nr:hypothetical protein [Olegusella massiliensis]